MGTGCTSMRDAAGDECRDRYGGRRSLGGVTPSNGFSSSSSTSEDPADQLPQKREVGKFSGAASRNLAASRRDK
eukprot:5176882-Amphidinium_carterae.2